MSVTIVATPGAANANSFETLVEAQAYFDSRLPLAGWDNAEDQNVLLVMGTRLLDNFAMSLRQLVTASGGVPAYYRTSRKWTGSPATATQRLSWPRIGMYDKNGNLIPSDVIPQDLKDALAEFAGQLGISDRTLDNDVIIQGLTSVKAGSVSLSFKDQIFKQVVPDAVLDLLVPGWLTDELVEPANPAFVEVGSRGSEPWPGGDRW